VFSKLELAKLGGGGGAKTLHLQPKNPQRKIKLHFFLTIKVSKIGRWRGGGSGNPSFATKKPTKKNKITYFFNNKS
jgi:hypothetical protein